MITKQTRYESHEDIKPKKQERYNLILEHLNRPKTVMELTKEIFDSDNRNLVAPRLTEMAKMGYVVANNSKKCEYTGKTVALYERTTKGLMAISFNHIPRID